MSKFNKDSKMYIKPGKLAHTILKWMQEKEGTPALKKTTGHIIAEKISELDGVESGVITIEQVLSKMVKLSVIYRDKYPKSIYSDYRINYWHKSIPKDILANAPVEEKRSMAKTIDDMKPGQYMDDEGCVVTPGATVTDGDPFSEDAVIVEDTGQQDEEEEPILPEEQVQEICDKAVQPYEAEKEVQEVSVPVEVKKDGKTMSITVNLTINL